MLLGLAACQAHHGIVVLVENDNKEVRSIRLFVGTGDSASSSLTPSTKVQVDDAEYWVRDPGNELDLVDVSDQAELRFLFETDATIPVAIAVGYDGSGQPIAAGLAHDLAPMDGTDFTGYELTLVSPISAIGPAGGPMQVALWSPPPMTSQLDAACAGVIVAGEDHPYFVVSEQDQDCDGLRDDDVLECNPDVFLGERPADPSEASCLVAGVGSAGEADCQLGGEPCTDNVPRGQGQCNAGHTCVPVDVCMLCGSSFECAADLASSGHADLALIPHYECALHRKPDGSTCGETFALERPPTGGYDCTQFQIGNSMSALGDKLKVDNLVFSGSMHTGAGTSCAAEIVPSGLVGTTTSLTALVGSR